MKYYIIAGEASGDLHGSLLMGALAARDPQADFRFWGGEKMEAVGGTKVRDYSDTAVMGIVEVLAKAGTVRRNLAFCKADIAGYGPDVVILIDYPGFNLKIASYAHEHGFKVYYYIAPKVWASRERRVEQLRRYVDRLFVLFPFEVEYFRSKGIEPVYEGNPLVDHIDSVLAAAPSREEFFRGNGLESKPVIALLAGSRVQEIKFLAPRFIELANKTRLAGFQFVIAGAPGISRDVYKKYFGDSFRILYGQTYELLKYSEAAAVASGTASFEAAVIGTPQVVCYGMNPLSFKIVISVLKVPYISLANLIMDSLIFKELLQEKCTTDALAAELARLTTDYEYRAAMERQYELLRGKLGPAGSATRIATTIYESILSGKGVRRKGDTSWLCGATSVPRP